jgi:hypothetical protein
MKGRPCRACIRRCGRPSQKLPDAQRVAQAGEAESDAPLVARFFLLAFQRPGGHVEDVVEHPGGDLDDFTERFEIELGLVAEGMLDEQREVD